MVKRFSPARVRDAAPLFAALGDPTRLGLVLRLQQSPPTRPVTALTLCALECRSLGVHQNTLFGEAARDASLELPLSEADVVAFLASEDARWVTGQNLRADGGIR